LRYLIAADTGGTFTDLAVFDTETGQARFGKTLTDYDDLIEGVVRGLNDADATISEAALVKHGTTHVINALLERRGARTALLATEGFRDVVEIGRGNRSVPFDLRYRRQPPLVPRALRYDVGGRIDGLGNELRALDIDAMTRIAEDLRQQAVEAVAIAFLNAYRNPLHEQQAKQFIADALPGVFVTISSDLSREWSEYERSSTAAANAFVGPAMTAYLRRFEKRLDERNFQGRLYMMSSSGGVLTVDQAASQPIAMVESGPVGGCIAAAEYARALGLNSVIAFDMGGTTAKCALVEGGVFDSLSTYYIGGYEHGLPIRTPVLDIVEVGTGGGSIAWLDNNGRLRVGPRSAGSTPGPIAFGRGGTLPTVTDANAMLGRIGANSFMNGKLALDIAAAEVAIRDQIATPLGFAADDTDAVAQGIIDIASTTMTEAIKEISIERGRDVRQYSLIAFGGGGPIFAAELARALRIPQVVIPPNPGAFSSFGMLMANARSDMETTFIAALSDDVVGALTTAMADLEARLTATMRSEFGAATVEFSFEADMRYASQSHSVRVRLPAQPTASAIRENFERIYAARYGHVNEGVPPEFIMLRAIAHVATARPQLSQATDAGTAGTAVPRERRSIYWVGSKRRIDTPVFKRTDLPIGFEITGPAIIEEYSSTTVLPEGDQLVVGTLGEINIFIRASAPRGE